MPAADAIFDCGVGRRWTTCVAGGFRRSVLSSAEALEFGTVKKLRPTVPAASPGNRSWMVKRDSANLVLNVRRDSKQRALQEALLVPWPLLAESAAAFAEWHMFILWVRAITETADQLPEIVRSALQCRCPGFLECQGPERKDDLP